MTAAQVRNAFGGKLHINGKLAAYVCQTITKLPGHYLRHITSDCWFLGSVEDAWAYTFRGDELEGKHLIILSDTLLDRPKEDIEWTIMHEVGHVLLGHQNSILVTQSKREVRKQEWEADEFARVYLGR